MIIAIDGTSAAGKGTLAQRLQQHFDLGYLDTGALYRAVGKKMIQNGDDPEDAVKAESTAKHLKKEEILHLQYDSSIRNEECGRAASKVSAIPGVRKALFDFQRDFCFHPVKLDKTPAKGAVLDGRDIGTVVCPEADIKIYLIASAQTRAKRRLKELQEKGICVIYDEVLKDVLERDARDSSRAIAPLKPADDALILDTSDMAPDDVFAAVIDFINGKK